MQDFVVVAVIVAVVIAAVGLIAGFDERLHPHRHLLEYTAVIGVLTD